MSSLEGDRFLDPAELVALFEALEDESAEVRIAAFEALTRLPLAPSDWLEVASFIDPRPQTRATRTLSASPSEMRLPGSVAKDRSPPEPRRRWIGRRRATWIHRSLPAERAEVEAALATRDEAESLGASRPAVGPEQAREQAVAVTLLFEEVLRGRPRAHNRLPRRQQHRPGRPRASGTLSSRPGRPITPVPASGQGALWRVPERRAALRPASKVRMGTRSLFKFVEIEADRWPPILLLPPWLDRLPRRPSWTRPEACHPASVGGPGRAYGGRIPDRRRRRVLHVIPYPAVVRGLSRAAPAADQ